jgi:hypothetical protein
MGSDTKDQNVVVWEGMEWAKCLGLNALFIKILKAMFHQFFKTRECRNKEMHLGDVWKHPPNYRGHWGLHHAGYINH